MSSRLLLSEPIPAELCYDNVSEADRSLAADYSAQRAAETLTWRAMVNNHLGAVQQFGYDSVGAPIILNSTLNIGVSHTSDLVAVVLSDRACAVDVERKDRNVERISERFFSPLEKSLCHSTEHSVAIWCARECYYKLCRNKSLSLLTDIHITALNIEAGSVTVQSPLIEAITLRITQTADHFVVYII